LRGLRQKAGIVLMTDGTGAKLSHFLPSTHGGALAAIHFNGDTQGNSSSFIIAQKVN
jgi:hypothetical protein